MAPSTGLPQSSCDAMAREVTAAMVAGSRTALEHLFRLRCALIEREAERALGHRTDLAADAAQEAWLRVARRPVPCPCSASLDGWLRRVAVSAAVDLLRADLARRAREHQVARTRAEAASFVADWAQLDEAQEALMHLPNDERGLLELRARTEATLAQLGRAVGLGPAALDSRLRRAVQRARAVAEQGGRP
jgi:RNA polymerase sigma factor (sigma-70 family)